MELLVFIAQNNAPMTDGDRKILLSVFIILNIFWVVCWVFNLTCYALKMVYIREVKPLVYLDILMILLWVFVIIGWLAIHLSKYI